MLVKRMAEKLKMSGPVQASMFPVKHSLLPSFWTKAATLLPAIALAFLVLSRPGLSRNELAIKAWNIAFPAHCKTELEKLRLHFVQQHTRLLGSGKKAAESGQLECDVGLARRSITTSSRAINAFVVKNGLATYIKSAKEDLQNVLDDLDYDQLLAKSSLTETELETLVLLTSVKANLETVLEVLASTTK
jgi:hypothetical protein